ncbi:MAG: TIGR03067 domain-containing protein [Fimbriiglobus sp.]
MRAWIMACAFVACVAIATGQTPTPSATPATISEELKKLQGYWKCAAIQFDGKDQMSAKERENLTLVVKDAEYRMYFLSDAKKDEHFRLFTAEVKLEAEPKTMELTVNTGKDKGKKVHGIYELSKEQFRICYGPADKPRPTKFETTKDSGHFLETWKPEKRIASATP